MMNRFSIAIVLILCVSRVTAEAGMQEMDVDSLYQQANGDYQEGRFEQALSLYRQILGRGKESADLYYNMGNAAFRSNNIGYSILYYEKALKLDPSHEDASHNLEFVSRYKVDAFDEVPELFLRIWREKLVRMLSERSWSILSLALFFCILVNILIYLFAKRLHLKKAGFFVALVALILFVVTFTSALTRHNNIQRPESGIIVSPSVLVRSSPSETGTELFVLHEGTKFQIKEEVGGWQNIRIIDGREGWIESSQFESI